MATNSNYDPAKKTTKLIRGIHSWIKFQKHQGVESLSIEGKQALADISQDKNGDTNLILNADGDKINGVESHIPYITVSTTWSGSDPDKWKVEGLNQDLTQFPLRDGKLIKFTKESESISVNEDALKENISEMIKTEIDKVPVVLGYYSKLFSQFEKQTTNITFKDDQEFNGYLLIQVRSKQGATTFFHFNREDFIDVDKPYKIYNDYMFSVRAELTPDKNLILIFNQHTQIGEEFELYYQWFTSMQKAPIEPRWEDKRITTRVEFPTEHFEGYENPNVELTYSAIPPVTSTPNPAPSETPSNQPSLPNVTFPMASTSPQPELAGNQPQPIAEESH